MKVLKTFESFRRKEKDDRPPEVKKCENLTPLIMNSVSKYIYDIKALKQGWDAYIAKNEFPDDDQFEYKFDTSFFKMFLDSKVHFGMTDDLEPSIENIVKLSFKNGNSILKELETVKKCDKILNSDLFDYFNNQIKHELKIDINFDTIKEWYDDRNSLIKK